ncbi:hypothetical protein CWN21_21365 [Klebsiella pneumoniae]|nr:hypothetical protein CWN21_21365 [Klebsiella pneumoniae]
MNNKFTYTIKRTRFDENYNPAENTRITTNFANLARGVNREENLRNTLIMMNNRLIAWPTGIIPITIAMRWNWILFLSR